MMMTASSSLCSDTDTVTYRLAYDRIALYALYLDGSGTVKSIKALKKHQLAN